MKRFILMLLLLMTLGLGSARAEPVPRFYAVQDTFYIDIESGYSGRNIERGMVYWLNDLKPLVALVNAKQGYFVCEITNDPKKWRILQRWLSEHNITEQEFEGLNPVFDGGVNTDRMSTLTDILKSAGLTVLDLRYVPSREASVYVKLYYEAYLASSTARVEPERIIERYIETASRAPLRPVIIPAWGLGTRLGLEFLSPKTDVTPCAAATIYHDDWLLEVHGGHSLWKTQRSVLTENDQTFNRYFGVRVGYMFWDPVSLFGGVYQVENLVWTPREYRDSRLYRLRAAEAGLRADTQHFSAVVSLLYGYEKNYGEEMENNFSLRCSVLVGNVWGW